MPDETGEQPESTAPAAPAVVAQPRHGFFRRHWGKSIIALIVLLPTVVFTIWSGVALSFTYSSGERVGFVQKLAKKGWVCKTWEGELQMSNIPGSAPMLFVFTVRSDSLARAIEQSEGKQVSLHYEQHMGVPSSCFGDTQYFVTSQRVLGDR